MATIQAEVSKHHKKKDGTIPVKIRVTHKQKMRRLATNLVAYPEDLTRDYRLKGNLKRRAENLVREMYDAIEDISYFDMEKCDVDFIVKHIRSKVEERDWHLDFFHFAKQYLDKAAITESTKHTYQVALSALSRFVGKAELDINDITSSFLQDFAAFLSNEPKYHYNSKLKKTVATKKKKRSGAGDRVYFVKLGTIFNEAKKRYNDEDMDIIRIPRSPFKKVSIDTTPPKGQDPLPLSVIKTMIRAETHLQSERDALDIFLLSLGLMGVNMVDLYKAAPPSKASWDYERTKTTHRRLDRAKMKVKIPDCLSPYITRLSTGSAPDRWLNLSRRFKTQDSATQCTNKCLKAWAKKNGLPDFTFYAARKTWATIAHSKECGVDKATVDECLAHVGDLKNADIYIQRDWEVIWEANRKVCELIWGQTQ